MIFFERLSLMRILAPDSVQIFLKCFVCEWNNLYKVKNHDMYSRPSVARSLPRLFGTRA